MSMSQTNRILGISPKALILAAALLTAMLILVINWDVFRCFLKYRANTNPPCGKITFLKTTHLEDNIPIFCNQVILDRSHPNADSNELYLKNLCFEKKNSCQCGPQLELWEYPPAHGVDIGTVVQQGPKTGGIGDGTGLMANFVIDFMEPQKFYGDSLSYDPNNLSVQIPCTASDTVKIAIVDTGVDTISDPSHNKLREFQWRWFNEKIKCYPRTRGKYGASIPSPSIRNEPHDLNGHGTSVNAVATGAAAPRISIPVPIKFVNVGIMQGRTKVGSFYDAICGLYYAIEQDPAIINISWGFLFKHTQENLVMTNSIKDVFNDFFNEASRSNILVVTGMGNNGKKLNDTERFYPACLADEHANGLAIGALNQDENYPDIARFSNYCDSANNLMTLAAPGTDIICAYPEAVQQIALDADGSTISPTGVAIQSGTSFAAPYVSRLAALIKSLNPTLSPNEIKNKIISLCYYPQNSNSGKYFRVLNLKLLNQICPQATPPAPPI